MYKYVFKKSVQDRLEYYQGGIPSYNSFKKLTHQGFPNEYPYFWVLWKCIGYVFYSKRKLQQVFVNGYPVPVEFFDMTKE